MKFDFSLEPVLKVRKHEEKIQKQKLAEKLSQKKIIAKKKQELKEKLQAHLGTADSKDFHNLHDLKRHRRYINSIHKEVEKLNGNLRIVENAIEQQRDKLAEVHKKRHIMEKIKEEEHELFLEKLSRQQRKMMDEIATQSYSK
ncbi:flagellar export protein FliJ [Fodinibius halophilus]|uniref:Flagellar FliJ protein n=1 Tax=Fodinibius halophilus TaxID=1736908 RepID=A0A6M1TFJ1_9BACT|nr:flagellar export protein FliJ [Fodinibius halophilus]NGP87400.1 flagellar export protein FliJ [Fodinibius halophilus]